MTKSTKLISATNYKGETVQLTKGEYLSEWKHSSIQDLKGLIAYSKNYNAEHHIKLINIEDSLKVLALEMADSDFEAKADTVETNQQIIDLTATIETMAKVLEGIDPIAGKRFIDEQAGRLLKLEQLNNQMAVN